MARFRRRSGTTIERKTRSVSPMPSRATAMTMIVEMREAEAAPDVATSRADQACWWRSRVSSARRCSTAVEWSRALARSVLPMTRLSSV
jgi:hypothetical protein